MGRDDAYAIVQGAAMQAWEGEGGFRELVGEGRRAYASGSATNWTDLFDPSYALRNLGVVFGRVEDLKRRLEDG